MLLYCSFLRETGKFQPEGCLLCCPAPLTSWRAGARCRFAHWRLPLASFPAHHSFVCWKNERKRYFTIKYLPLAMRSHSLLTPFGERGVLNWIKSIIVTAKGDRNREKTNIYSAQHSPSMNKRGKNFYSFQSTNLVKACFTKIGLLTSGMPLNYHLNIHVVHPIINSKILPGTFVKSCFSLWETELLNSTAETFLSFMTELPERQILLHSMFAWTIAIRKVFFHIVNDILRFPPGIIKNWVQKTSGDKSKGLRARMYRKWTEIEGIKPWESDNPDPLAASYFMTWYFFLPFLINIIRATTFHMFLFTS